MNRRMFYLGLALCFAMLSAAKPVNELGAAKGLPEGVAKEVSATLNADGYQVSGPKGPVCSLWLSKSLEVKAGFKPTLNVKYPFALGQLVGVLQVAEKAKFTDFRGQEIKPGVYTLRYGKQPEDGNHIGTSELYDFLVAIPAKDDSEPKAIDSFQVLAKMSAKASGGTHPAIFSLLPVEKPAAKPVLEHDEEKEHYILNATTSGKADKTDLPVPVRLVVIGKSEG
jgi:hypothetical protein